MSLSLKQVIDQVKAQEDPTLGYVFDAPIHYVVMNNGENVWNLESMDKLEKVYETIEKTTGPGVVVTIGTGTKYFGTGFDLKWWFEDIKTNPVKSIARAQALLNRVLVMNMPTMAVFNGHAFAGGLILGLVHDFRIMTNDPKRAVCLSEINIGLPLPSAYNSMCSATLTK